MAKQQKYIKKQIRDMAADLDLFKRVYRYTFVCAKEKGNKALPVDTALVYWELLFQAPGRPWVTRTTDWFALWTSFLKTNWNKTVNKDMWNQLFEFFLKTLEDDTLGFWSEDSAWPGVIDDFVAYAKQQRPATDDMVIDLTD